MQITLELDDLDYEIQQRIDVMLNAQQRETMEAIVRDTVNKKLEALFSAESLGYRIETVLRDRLESDSDKSYKRQLEAAVQQKIHSTDIVGEIHKQLLKQLQEYHYDFATQLTKQ